MADRPHGRGVGTAEGLIPMRRLFCLLLYLTMIGAGGYNLA
jgi:hypothetical protein